MAAVEAPIHGHLPSLLETLTPDDFETASIRSAAPSYTSDAPSYHSTALPDPLPPYTPRESPNNASSSTLTNTSSDAHATTWARRPSLAPLIPLDPHSPPGPGLPPVPSGPIRNHHIPTIPTLGQFRIPSWSTISSPTARVALRRSAAAGYRAVDAARQDARRIMLDRIVEEESARERTRRLEDPYLVGEHAAAQARRERLARERSSGDEVLIREDRRWDFFLGELGMGRRGRGGRSAMR